MFRLAIWIGCLALFPESVRSAGDVFAGRIAAIEKEFEIRIGVVAIDTKSGRKVEYRSQERFPMCSTFKLLAVAAVLQRVDRGEENLDRFITYTQRDILAYAPVTKEHLAEGGMHSGALCQAAIEESDNTAANLLLQTIGGPEGVTNFARSLGDSVTRLDRTEPDLNRFGSGDDRDTTEPGAMCTDIIRLFTTDILSRNAYAQLEAWLKGNQTGANLIRAGVPRDWQVGDKTGRSGNGAINDIGILRPPDGSLVAIAIYSLGEKAGEEKRAAGIAKIASIVAEMFRPDSDRSSSH